MEEKSTMGQRFRSKHRTKWQGVEQSQWTCQGCISPFQPKTHLGPSSLQSQFPYTLRNEGVKYEGQNHPTVGAPSEWLSFTRSTSLLAKKIAGRSLRSESAGWQYYSCNKPSPHYLVVTYEVMSEVLRSIREEESWGKESTS